MTNKELRTFISNLKRAKREALRLWPKPSCVLDGATENDIWWALAEGSNAEFCHKSYSNQSCDWMRSKRPTRQEVSAMFDRSIAFAEGMMK